MICTNVSEVGESIRPWACFNGRVSQRGKTIFCPRSGGGNLSASKRMVDALLAGCTPIVLSHDCGFAVGMRVITCVCVNGRGSHLAAQLLGPDNATLSSSCCS